MADEKSEIGNGAFSAMTVQVLIDALIAKGVLTNADATNVFVTVRDQAALIDEPEVALLADARQAHFRKLAKQN